MESKYGAMRGLVGRQWRWKAFLGVSGEMSGMGGVSEGGASRLSAGEVAARDALTRRGCGVVRRRGGGVQRCCVARRVDCRRGDLASWRSVVWH